MTRATLALSEAELREHLADVEADRDIYRELLTHALAGWHVALDERDRLRRRVYDLLDIQREAA